MKRSGVVAGHGAFAPWEDLVRGACTGKTICLMRSACAGHAAYCSELVVISAFICLINHGRREIITGLPNDGVAECMATYVVDTTARPMLIKKITFVWKPRTFGVKMH